MPTCRHEISKLVSIQSHHHPIKKWNNKNDMKTNKKGKENIQQIMMQFNKNVVLFMAFFSLKHLKIFQLLVMNYM